MPTLTPRSIVRARDPITHEVHLIELEASMALCGTVGTEALKFCDGAEPMDRHCIRCIRRFRGEPDERPAADPSGWKEKQRTPEQIRRSERIRAGLAAARQRREGA